MKRNRFLTSLVALLALPTLGRATATDFIVEVRPGIRPADIALSYSIKLKDIAAGSPFALFTADSSRIDALETALAADPRVAFAELEENVQLAETDTTSRGGTIPVVGSVDHLDQENANLLSQIHWNASFRTLTLTRVKVGILDTGISLRATTLLPRMVRYQNHVLSRTGTLASHFDMPDTRYALTAPQNQGVGHGTMVAGLIAEIAPNADLIVEKVADTAGAATSWTIIKGLADAVFAKAALVNISMGAPGPIVAFEEAFQWASSRGVIVCAPAGNEGLNRLLEPAALDGVLAVAGVDSADHKASFSNWHKNVVASAPAEGIRSVNWDGNMAIWMGTSFSTPLVTGAICLGIGSGKTVTPANAPDFVKAGGDSLDGLNPAYTGQLGTMLDVQKLLLTAVSNAKRP